MRVDKRLKVGWYVYIITLLNSTTLPLNILFFFQCDQNAINLPLRYANHPVDSNRVFVGDENETSNLKHKLWFSYLRLSVGYPFKCFQNSEHCFRNSHGAHKKLINFGSFAIKIPFSTPVLRKLMMMLMVRSNFVCTYKSVSA